MAVTYRAMWEADDPDVSSAAWLCLAGHAAEIGLVLPEVGSVRTSMASALVRRACEGKATALQVQLTDQRAATVLTTLTCTRPGDAPTWVTCEVEVVSDGIREPGPLPEAPPWAVELLRQCRGRSGRFELPVKAEVADGDVGNLVGDLLDADRSIPFVVIASGASLDVVSARRRAERIAVRLAGTVRVVVLTPAAAAALSEMLGEALAVPSSCVRLFLPGLDRDDPQPLLHRIIHPDQVDRSLDATAERVARGLAPRIAAATVPDRVRATTEGLLATAPITALDLVAAQLREVERSLRQARADSVEQHDRAVELFDEIERLTIQNTGFASELRRLRGLVAMRGVNPFDDGAGVLVPSSASTCRRALDQAREHLHRLAIPDSAYARVDELDDALESATWSNIAWRALRSLDSYAASGGGNFFTWCTTSGDPLVLSPRAFAMAESETVMNNRRMRDERRFGIDSAVDGSGFATMQAHVKIERIGPVAPRLYFLDDTAGSTGKVHVGYLGPHLTTTRTS